MHRTHLVWKYISKKKMYQRADPPGLKAQGLRIPKIPISKLGKLPFPRYAGSKIASYVCSAEIEKSDFFRKTPISPI